MCSMQDAARNARARRAVHAVVPVLACALPAAPAAQAETLFSVYTGSSYTRDSTLHLSQPAAGTGLDLDGVAWDADPFKPAPYYGLRVTHFYDDHPNWGAALEFTHYKMYAKTGETVTASGTWRGAPANGAVPMERYVQRFEMSHGVNMLSINGVYRWLDTGLAAGRLEPYAGAGLAYYLPHAESTVGNVQHATGYDGAGFGLHLFAGARYLLTERIGAFAELKFDGGNAKVGIADGNAETRVRSFHAVAGVSFRF
ncbi:MAG TPA: outer membrane beta-barrel protein [Noviherbaspirillum sp.]|uniref:outer membrane beta-barrel protein n=1 Tax=Noviherbaspirillum sp. TaxID=1926288 RepID=UPI002D414D9F|nr:outer membrane beta-barrel protein [Noviherbaspirillum sp.]HYD94995.1 outer membrane beta-barrel protein [Noviherbaspirillum sp.]